jgi:hypothetical protein
MADLQIEISVTLNVIGKEKYCVTYDRNRNSAYEEFRLLGYRAVYSVVSQSAFGEPLGLQLKSLGVSQEGD